MDEVASPIQEPRITIGEIARHLFHPFSIGLPDNSGNLDSTSLEVDDEEHEVPNQASPRQHLGAEEIGCRYGSPVSLQEGLPRHRSCSKRGGIQPIIKEDSLDRVAAAKSLCDEALAGSARRDLVPQVVECSSNSRATPGRILTRHLQDQLLDLDGCPGAPNRAALAPIVLPRDQPPIPPKQGVRRHECS